MGTLPTGHTSCCSTQSGLTRAISKHQQDRQHSFSDWENSVALRAFLLAVKVCSRILDRPSVSAQNSTLLTAAQRPSCPVLSQFSSSSPSRGGYYCHLFLFLLLIVVGVLKLNCALLCECVVVAFSCRPTPKPGSVLASAELGPIC